MNLVPPSWWAAFALWLSSNGAELNTDLWTAADTKLAFSTGQGAQPRGVGLFAIEDLKSETLLFSIPPDLIVFAVRTPLIFDSFNLNNVVPENG